jgi:ABC-type antimicrobial peptide transport system permease subunit
MPDKTMLSRWIDAGWLDVRLGLRLLRKFPGLTLVGGVGMAVAIAVLLDRLSGGELLGAGSAILLTAMSALMIAVGLLASVGPARRGLRIQPTEALRDQ